MGEKIMNTISHLQHINAKEERKTDEVRAFVKDMLRVFNTDKPLVFPTGCGGDVGKGAQTAYDALPPKKWVNPDKLWSAPGGKDEKFYSERCVELDLNEEPLLSYSYN